MSTQLLDNLTIDPSGDFFAGLADNASQIKADSLMPLIQDFLNRVKDATGFSDADLVRAIAQLPQLSTQRDALTEVADTMMTVE